jgi:hypothetical protein
VQFLRLDHDAEWKLLPLHELWLNERLQLVHACGRPIVCVGVRVLVARGGRLQCPPPYQRVRRGDDAEIWKDQLQEITLLRGCERPLPDILTARHTSLALQPSDPTAEGANPRPVYLTSSCPPILALADFLLSDRALGLSPIGFARSRPISLG